MRIRLICLVVIAFSCTTLASAQRFYRVIDLVPDATVSSVFGINNLGQVVGSYVNSSHRDVWFIWQNGNLTQINCPDANGTYCSGFNGINNAGQLIGTMSFPSGPSQPFVWQNGTFTFLGANPPPYFRPGVPFGINDSGLVAGQGSNLQATLWSGGNVIDIHGSLCEDYPDTCQSSAGPLNNAGQIIVARSDPDHPQEDHSWIWKDGVLTDIGGLSLGGPAGNTATYIHSINAAGQVAGESIFIDPTNPSNTLVHAFLWSNGQMTDLTPSLGSDTGANVSGINNSGQVAGAFVNLVGPGHYRAALFTQGGSYELKDLVPSNPGWDFVIPEGINDTGQIVGMGIYQGNEKAFLLDPLPCTPPTIAISNTTADATSSAGAVVSYDVSASDDSGLVASLNCSTPSGSTFPIGTTPITCTATDYCGNTVNQNFNITVIDEPPVLSLPTDIHALATVSTGAVVTYSASATDVVSGSLPVSCSPASGSTFPIGTTVVNCSATDTAGHTATGHFSVNVANWIGRTLPTFAAPVSYPLPALNDAFGSQIVTADFNNDGKADVAALLTRTDADAVRIFLSDSSGGLGSPITLDYPAESIAVGDFNNDGNVDLVIGLSGDVGILHGDGRGHFGPPSWSGIFDDEPRTLALAVGDFNNDNKLDVFRKGFYNSGVFLGDGFGVTQASSFQDNSDYAAPDNLLVADFNGDGNMDILVTSGSIGFGDGTGNFGFLGGLAIPNSVPGIGNILDRQVNLYTVGDFNGDGKLDIATPHVTINLGDGAGGFALAQYYQTERGHSPSFDIKNADLNGDGKLDLVVTAAGKVSVLLNNGDGSFVSSGPLSGIDSLSAERVAIADFNGDGKPDIAVLGSDIPGPCCGYLANPRLVVWYNTTYQTPFGTNSTVIVNNTTFTFDDVTAGGTTSVTPIDPASVGQVPGGFSVSDSVAYEIATTATFTGSVTLSFKVPGPISQADFDNLAILHNVNGTLVDVTASTPARDYANLTIYATTTSFSPFYLARKGAHIKSLFDQTKAYKSGSTIPIKLQVLSASNGNTSSANTSLVTRDLRLMSGNTMAPIQDSGNANPDYAFRYDPTLGGTGGGYIFNLSTKGLNTGQYVLSFYVGSDRSFFYAVKFEVK